MSRSPSQSEVLAKISGTLGPGNSFSGDEIGERYRTDIMRKFRSEPLCVARPADTAQVAEVVKIAAAANVSITPLGGRTGVVGGGICEPGGIVLSLERMNHIVELDADSMTMTVEAGIELQRAQEAAEARGFIIPLDLGARGSATIGGNLATNAGGNRVLRWGTARDMVLGLEAVLADGSVVSSLSKSLKDNAGYHWRDLLIGSEGTLGIITRAVLRMRPQPTSAQTALVALGGFDRVAPLLRRLEGRFAGQLSSFELMWLEFYEFVTAAQLKSRWRPLAADYPLYALIETLGGDVGRDSQVFEEGLAEAQAAGLIEDAAIAQTSREREALWAVRDDLTEAFRPLFPLAAFDVSLALKDMPEFVAETRKALRKSSPDCRTLYYGHAGDGNLHLIVNLDPGDAHAEARVDEIVYDCVRRLKGSISAEHGIGTAKREYLNYTRSPEELALMQTLKNALDPRNILNPGKILPVHGERPS